MAVSFDNEFLEKQKKALEKELEKLEKELSMVAEKKKKGKDVDYKPKFLDFGQKEDEGAQEVTTYEEFLALESNLSKMFKDTKKALRKLQKGDYGRCERCKKLIEKERLEIVPTASLCLSCANAPKRKFSLAFWRGRR